MPYTEIITGLRNAIERKETLEQAMQIMIESGYDAKEVQEASKFVKKGALSMEEPKPEEQLIMPQQKKGAWSKLKFWKKKSEKQETPETQPQLPTQPFKEQTQQIIQQQTQQIQQSAKQIQKLSQQIQPGQNQNQNQKAPLVKQLQAIKPRKPSHLKIIILIIIILILLGILALTFFFSETIIG